MSYAATAYPAEPGLCLSGESGRRLGWVVDSLSLAWTPPPKLLPQFHVLPVGGGVSAPKLVLGLRHRLVLYREDRAHHGTVLRGISQAFWTV